MSRCRNGYGYAAAALVSLMWSTSAVTVKLLPWSAFSINFVRSTLGLIVLLFFSKGRELKVDKISLGGAGLLMLSMALAFLGAKRTTAANASFLGFTYPVFIILFGFLRQRKKPSVFEGGLLCLFATGILICCSSASVYQTGVGDFYSVLGSAAYSGMLFLSASHQERQKDMQIIGCILTAVCCFPAVLQETALDWKTVCLLLYLGVFSNGLAYILQEYAIRRISIVTYSFITISSPVLSTLWAYLLCGEQPSPRTWLGGAFILVAALAEAFPLLGKNHASQAISE